MPGNRQGLQVQPGGAEGLKLPSPFALTVRAATDYVKAFRKHLPWAKVPSWPSPLSTTNGFVLIPEHSCTEEQGLAPMSAPGKAIWLEWVENAHCWGCDSRLIGHRLYGRVLV